MFNFLFINNGVKMSWEIYWGNYNTFASINESPEKRICTIKSGEYGQTPKEAEFNAKLLAYSPDLLEIVEQSLKRGCLESIPTWEKEAKRIVDIIRSV